MNMIGYAVHLIANTVHLSGAPDVLYMIVSTVHLMANAVHPSGAPEVQHGICSTLDGKCSTPSEAPDEHDAVHLIASAVHPSGVLYIIVSTVHLIANSVLPCGAPLSLQYTMANVVHPSVCS